MSDTEPSQLIPRPCLSCWKTFETCDLDEKQICLVCSGSTANLPPDREARLAEVNRRLALMQLVPPTIVGAG